MVASAAWGGAAGPQFETLLELGQGGMAIAYLARALGAGGFERLVVLKRLNLELTSNPEAIDRFLAEARVAARLHHVNVIGTQQVGRDSAGPYIVLDYVEGGALDELVNASIVAQRPLSPRVLLRIALDALSGLRAVHEATDSDQRPLEILHRDVSLENVLVSVHDGVARVSDFGVARSVLNPVRTAPGYLVGKLLYLAPEYLKREPVGPTLDLYALGVALWLALTREKPWPRLSEGQLVRAIVEEGVPSLAGYPGIAPELAALVARACERDPQLRFQSAREMAVVIEGFDRERGWVASHAEVAAAVDELLGVGLERRRRALAARGRPTHEDSVPTPAPLAYAATLLEPEARAPAHVATIVSPRPAREPVPIAPSLPRPPRRRLLAVAASAVTLGAAALTLALLHARSAPLRPNGPRQPVPDPPLAVSSPPLLTPSSAATVPSVFAVSPLEPPRARPRPGHAKPAQSARVLPPVPERAPVVGIQTKNPYR